jgi:WD40 repeat protein
MKSPFKFLDSYTKDDREIFFGRDREIEELYHRVFESKIMLVYGVSGTGKSSLIHCGLANKFQDTDWLPIVIRRGGNIIESMAAGIRSASITEQQSKLVTAADFKKGVRSLYLDHYKPVFFIFDQFEELFIFGDKEERRSFIQIVKSLVESELQCRFIFVMREEYMAWVTEFEKIITTFFSNRVRIEKMSHWNALEAIKGPCNAFNISLEEGFSENLLEKLSPGETDVELTYLQVYLDKIFRLAAEILPPPGSLSRESGRELKGGSSQATEPKEELTFTLGLLDKTGNVSDLLGSFLEEQLSLLDNPETALAVLKSFVSVKGTKQPMRPEEVKEYALTLGKDVPEPMLVELIQTFVNLRVLRDKDQNGCYELRHDALAEKIFEKFTISEKELLEIRKFVENAHSNFVKRGIFLNKDDLDYISQYENKLILPKHLSEFIEQCRKKLLFRRKALKRITTISTLVFVLIAAAIGRSMYLNQSHIKEKELIGSMLIKFESDPVKLIKGSYSLWEKYPLSSVLQRIILKNFQKLFDVKADSSNQLCTLQEFFKPLLLPSPVIKAEISGTGKKIFGWMENQTVFIWNLNSNKIDLINTKGELVNLEIFEKDSLVAMIFKDNSVNVSDFHGKEAFNFKTSVNKVFNDRLLSFFPSSSEYSMTAVKDNGAVIYSRSGKKLFELNGHHDKVNSVDVSPDGRFIITVGDDNKGYIWNFNHDINRFSIYDSLIGHKDTIWSCEFNKTGKFILTASGDSTIKIWNLNGRHLNPEFLFAWNYQNIVRSRYYDGRSDNNATDKHLSAYYGKNCNASFSDDEMSLIVTGYKYDQDLQNMIKLDYSQVLLFDWKSKFYTQYWSAFSGMVQSETEKITPETFSKVVISPSGDRVAIVDHEAGQIDLLSPEGLRLITLEGNNPMFSEDGKELFWIKKNHVNRLPIDPKEIKDLLDKYKIPDSIKSGESSLIVL